MNALYYKPSGKFAPYSFLYFALLALIAIPLLALLYSYGIWYIPFVYISFFITIGFGLGVGMLVSRFVVKAGKVRNKLLATVFGILGGVFALYFNWVIWVDLVLNSGEVIGNSSIGVTVSHSKLFKVLELAMQPGVLWELIQEINQYGTWSLKGNTVSGTWLYVIWAVEALFILGISTFIPRFAAEVPFCEQGNRWFTEQELPAFSWIENEAEVLKNLEGAIPEIFSDLTVVNDPKVEGHSIFTVYTSSYGKAYLSITNKTAKQNRKGEIEFDSNEIVSYIAISKTILNSLVAK